MKEILEQAIQKAIDGGWNKEFARWIPTPNKLPTDFEFNLDDMDSGQKIGMRIKGENEWVASYDVAELIFNHDFAKALWPNQVIDGLERELWKGHLQNMVISEDPIKYLGGNI